MAEQNEVAPIGALSGMTVLSLASGEKVGQVVDLFVDPFNGVMLGLTLSGHGETNLEVSYDDIHSFGRDAIMVRADEAVRRIDEGDAPDRRTAKGLIGTKIITESGEVLGEIAEVFVTLRPPPFVIYEVRRSILDRLLGRTVFIPASVGFALSGDGERLIVPDITEETAYGNIAQLLEHSIDVRSFDEADDNTVRVFKRTAEDDETVLRVHGEDETILRRVDEDVTVVRRPRST